MRSLPDTLGIAKAGRLCKGPTTGGLARGPARYRRTARKTSGTGAPAIALLRRQLMLGLGRRSRVDRAPPASIKPTSSGWSSCTTRANRQAWPGQASRKSPLDPGVPVTQERVRRHVELKTLLLAAVRKSHDVDRLLSRDRLIRARHAVDACSVRSGCDLDMVDQAVAQLEPVAEIGLTAGEVPDAKPHGPGRRLTRPA